LPKIFVDSDKLCNEYNNIDKNEIGIYKRKRRYDSCNEFLADNRNFELKAKLFIPNIGEDMEYENRFANFGKNYIEKETPGNSYSFVVKNEIVSRAYQLNQLAHFVNIPYTAYLAYTNSTSEITNDKIWNFLNKTSEKNLLKDSYPMFEVRKVRMKVCQTVGIDSRIIVLDFDVNTGAYAAIRILKNKDGTTVFFPIVVQKPMKEKDLRSEYERVFVKKGDLFNDNFHKIEDEEWKTGFEYFQKDKQADQGYEYKEKCEKENCETAYIRLKAVYECAARRLTNIKSGILLYDFFNKLKTENVVNDEEFDELIENLSKCIREQFLSIGKNTENEEKIKKYFKNIYSKHKLFDILNVESDNIEEEKIDYLDDIYMNCGFRCHPDDSAETYRHLTALLEKYKETPYRRIKNSNNIKDYLYLIFCQEFGAFFNKLKDNDNMEHKIPPLSTHYLINMVFDRVVESEKELKELNIDNIDDKNMIVSCVTALLSVMEDGFGGSVVYAEPVENCPKNESFYIYDCVQHGEDPIQVNELFFSDFLCLHNLLEYSIKNMYKYLGKIDDKIAKQLKKKVLKTVQNFTNEFSEEFKYKDFIIEINKFEFYIDSSFSSWNSGRYEKYDISGGEGIYRSEIYTELSPEFENNFPNDENIKNFIEDIYEVKEKILKKI
ncbi:MAG: hypothetical protein LBM93_12930, partial [Oscillospiraceae bacterium]|jgi:hypothetical protein|nr:hypothetical protein [Oscillospiraceae bacterium]